MRKQAIVFAAAGLLPATLGAINAAIGQGFGDELVEEGFEERRRFCRSVLVGKCE
jgi:hypothetical protein